MRSPGLFGEKAFSRRGSGGTGLADGIAAAAFVFQGTATGTGSVAADRGGFHGRGLRGRFRWVDDFSDAEIGVHLFEFWVGQRRRKRRGALGFDEFDDLHGGFEPDRGGGFVVAQDLSKSVDCEVGEVAEFVDEAVGALLAQCEEGAGEVGQGAGPEVDGGAVDAGFVGGGGDGVACDEAFEDLQLNRRQSVEMC